MGEKQRKDFFLNFCCHLDLTSDLVKGVGKICRKSGFLRFLGNSKSLTLYCGSKHFNFLLHFWKQWWTDVGRDIMWASLYSLWFLLMYFSECVINAVVLSPATITWGVLKKCDVCTTDQANHIRISRGDTQASFFFL